MQVAPTLPTASGLDRALRCSGSMVLPRVNSEGSKAATRGTVIHAYLDNARTKDRAYALAQIDDDELRQQAAAIDLDSLPVGAEGEVALSYQPSTGEAKRLELTGAREYPNEYGWIFGTADLVGTTSEYVFVLDYKTGAQTVSASESGQLKFLALAAAVLSERKKARVALFFLNENGTWRKDEAEFGTKELGAFANDLREMIARGEAAAVDVAEGRTPPLATGPWCRYCKSSVLCPAQTSLVRALVPTLADVGSRLVSMTPAERGIAYARYKEAEGLLKEIGSAFQTLAEAEPIPLENGMVLKRVYSSRSSASKEAAAFIAKTYNLETLLGLASVDLRGASQEIKVALESNGLITTTRFPVLRQVKDKAR